MAGEDSIGVMSMCQSLGIDSTVSKGSDMAVSGQQKDQLHGWHIQVCDISYFQKYFQRVLIISDLECKSVSSVFLKPS